MYVVWNNGNSLTFNKLKSVIGSHTHTINERVYDDDCDGDDTKRYHFSSPFVVIIMIKSANSTDNDRDDDDDGDDDDDDSVLALWNRKGN